MKNWFTQRSGWKLRIKILILLFCFLTQSGRAQTCDRQRDSLALVALYNSTNGPNWSVTWDLNQPMTTWFGLTFNGDGCIERMNLIQNGLSGSLPTEIGEVLNLKWLVLDSNQLIGPIPTSIGNLTNLEVLSLGFNQFSGSIPTVIQKLTNLKQLFLLNNQLSGNIPASLSSLTNLEELFLDDNQLNGSIPNGLGQLSKLRILHLYRNQLTEAIPASIGNLSNLEELRLDENQINGSLPDELGQLLNMRILDVHLNSLTGIIPESFGDLLNIEELRLDFNQLFGVIPGSLGNLKKAKAFVLRVNQLTGQIPNSLGNLENVELLQLDQNNLTGNIPVSLGNLVKLYGLHLYENQLSGAIPGTLANLPLSKELVLRDNQLTGEIPPNLGGLSHLELIQLNNNQLSGCFDESLRPLCSVMYDFTNNPKLPWQGDFLRFCAGESQIGATCDDGNANTINDFIQNDCVCQGSRIGLPQVNLNLGCGIVQVGQTICIPVAISAIDSIVASEFTIAYNQQVFEFVSINNPHPDFDQPLVVNPIQSFGRVKVAWTSPAIVNGSSFRDNDVLFEICLRAKVPGNYPIDFIRSGEPLFLAYSVNGTEINPTTTGCTIQVNPVSTLDLFSQACYSLTTMQGTINLTGYGGTAPYNVSWSGPQSGSEILSNSGDTLRVTGLPQGTYTFRIQDAAGADSIKIIDLPSPGIGIDLSLNTIPRNPTCFGDADGRISVNPTGGTSPYFIQWSTGDFNTRVIDNLSPGNYSVTVTDANGCSTSGSDALAANPLGISVIRNTLATCLGVSDGFLQVAGTGGNSTNGFYNFELVGRLPVSNPRGSVTLSNLEPGVYPLVVSDGICKDTFNLTIDANIDFNVIAVFDTISCYGLSDGSVSLSYQTLKGTPAGSIDYRLIFPNGTTSTNSTTFTNLYAGSYIAVASDQAGCKDSLFFDIPEPSLIDTTQVMVTNSSCISGGGSISVTLVGGTQPYQYSWSNGATASNLTALESGDYNLTVTDRNGCTGTFGPFSVKNETISSNSILVDCLGDTAWRATILLNGSLDYQYFSTGWDVTIEKNQVVTSPIPPGQDLNLLIWADLNNFCDTGRIHIEAPVCGCITNAGTLVNGGDTIFLCPDFSGEIDFSPTIDFVNDGDDGLYYILYSGSRDSLGQIIFQSPRPFLNWSELNINLELGYYYFSAAASTNVGSGFDPNDYCASISEPVIIAIRLPPSVAFLTDEIISACYGSEPEIKLDLQGTAPFLISYTRNGAPQNILASTPNFSFRELATKDINLKLARVKDKYCEGKADDEVTILVEGKINANDYNKSYFLNQGERVLIDIFGSKGPPSGVDFEYFFIPNKGILTDGPKPGQATYIPEANQFGVFYIPFYLCSTICQNDCDTGLVKIIIERDCFNEENFNLPNILFPDGPAGTNRYFIVETTKLCADLYGESTTALRVFDRWGKITYRDENYQNNWSGTDQSGAPLPAGTYYYVLNIRHERGMEQVTGYITLLR